MLKIKNAFLLFFALIALLFGLSFYMIINSYLNLLLLKQYEQKIKSLDDVLKFGLLNELDGENIVPFAKETEADFIISSAQNSITSLKNIAPYEGFEQNKTIKFQNKKIMLSRFSHGDYNYTIVVYPRIVKLEDFWFKIFAIYAFCVIFIFVLFYFSAKKLLRIFKKSFAFLDSIHRQNVVLLEHSVFKEFNFLNKKLLKIKDKILKKEEKTKKQNEKISLKNTQLNSVICAISHELKNTLSVIDLSVSTLQDANLKDEALKKELLNKISRQSYKLNQLTHKLNFVFNLNTQNLTLQNFDLHALCQKIVQDPGFERVVLRGEASLVSADIFLIEQVIINLLSNALKYSQKEVILEVRNQNLKVIDFGRGIERDKIKLITKKFYKIDVKSENSFGLGLFLVKKILSIHKSYLEISSTQFQGSCFSFRLKSGDKI